MAETQNFFPSQEDKYRAAFEARDLNSWVMMQGTPVCVFSRTKGKNCYGYIFQVGQKARCCRVDYFDGDNALNKQVSFDDLLSWNQGLMEPVPEPEENLKPSIGTRLASIAGSALRSVGFGRNEK